MQRPGPSLCARVPDTRAALRSGARLARLAVRAVEAQAAEAEIAPLGVGAAATQRIERLCKPERARAACASLTWGRRQTASLSQRYDYLRDTALRLPD